MPRARGHQERGVTKRARASPGARGDAHTERAGTSAGMLRARGHAERAGTRTGLSTGTLSLRGRRAHRATELTGPPSRQDSAPRCSLGSASPAQGRPGRGVTTPVPLAGAIGALRGPGPHPAGSAAGAGRAALSQAGSPDPLNHWKIQRGSVTRDGSIPQRWAPGGRPSAHGSPWHRGYRNVGRDGGDLPGAERGCPAAERWHGDNSVPTASRSDGNRLERACVLTPASLEGLRGASRPASEFPSRGTGMERSWDGMEMETGITPVTARLL